MSLVNVNAIEPSTGTDITLGASGDTTTVPSGATLDISSATLTPPATMPASSGVNFTALNASNLGSGTVPAARLSGVGKVLQVITATDSTARSTTNTGFVTASNTLAVTITPASTSNKIFVMATATGEKGVAGVAYYTIWRDSTELGTTQGFTGIQSTGVQLPLAMSTLDSPSSTSAIVYQVYLRSNDGSTAYLGNGTYESTITCMEIGA